jgi:hypothetical protein
MIQECMEADTPPPGRILSTHLKPAEEAPLEVCIIFSKVLQPQAGHDSPLPLKF